MKRFTIKTRKETLIATSPIYKHNGNVLTIEWMDKQSVCLLSTVHSSGSVDKHVRDHCQPNSYRNIQKPKAIHEYNQYMAGVDRNDQMNSCYDTQQRTIKWWKKIVLQLLATHATNAFILYRSVTPAPEQETHRNFPFSVAEQLLHGFARNNVTGWPNLKRRVAPDWVTFCGKLWFKTRLPCLQQT